MSKENPLSHILIMFAWKGKSIDITINIKKKIKGIISFKPQTSTSSLEFVFCKEVLKIALAHDLK